MQRRRHQRCSKSRRMQSSIFSGIRYVLTVMIIGPGTISSTPSEAVIMRKVASGRSQLSVSRRTRAFSFITP